VDGVTRTIGKLDYGTPCGPNPVLLAAMKRQIEEAEEKRRESELRVMEMLGREATNGDSSAQYSLGFHYLHGIGCQTNEVMGLFWLLKASSQGNMSASNDLQELESEPISTNTLKR
jgi:TPR repeat protein